MGTIWAQCIKKQIAMPQIEYTVPVHDVHSMHPIFIAMPQIEYTVLPMKFFTILS